MLCIKMSGFEITCLHWTFSGLMFAMSACESIGVLGIVETVYERITADR